MRSGVPIKNIISSCCLLLLLSYRHSQVNSCGCAAAVIIFVALGLFGFVTYATGHVIGSPTIMYDNLQRIAQVKACQQSARQLHTVKCICKYISAELVVLPVQPGLSSAHPGPAMV